MHWIIRVRVPGHLVEARNTERCGQCSGNLARIQDCGVDMHECARIEMLCEINPAVVDNHEDEEEDEDKEKDEENKGELDKEERRKTRRRMHWWMQTRTTTHMMENKRMIWRIQTNMRTKEKRRARARRAVR